MKMMRKQKGVVLLLSLVILLVLSLLAVSGMQGSIMQERMSTAQRDGMFALEIAETAMIEAEATLDALVGTTDFRSQETGFYGSENLTPPGTLPVRAVPSPFDSATWELDGSGDPINAVKGTAVNGIEPLFMFEHKGKVVVDPLGQLPRDFSQYGGAAAEEFDYARILVRTAGPSGASMRLLEGFYVFVPGGLNTGT